MSTIIDDLLGSAFPTSPAAARFLRGGRDKVTADLRQPASPNAVLRRRRIWDIHDNFHCSIVGTCLSTAEARKILVHLRVKDAETQSDHEIHNRVVILARQPQNGGKFLQKALDRRHETTIRHFAKAKDADAVEALWQSALKHGDISGAYWAVLTHPLASEALIKKAFSDIHMLSHLVGAANRADIRRLRQMEDENAALVAKLERQQHQIRNGFIERDNMIEKLRQALTQAVENDRANAASPQQEVSVAWTQMIASLKRSLDKETTRRARLEQRLAALTHTQAHSERARRDAESRSEQLDAELSALEARIELVFDPNDADPNNRLDLRGVTVLYVGGRTGQVPRLKMLVQRVKGRLLHHDGGLDDNTALLPGLISQSDVIVFPVDCVSHGAVASVKRLSQQLAKRYVPLRTSSLSCLFSTLCRLTSERSPDATPSPVG